MMEDFFRPELRPDSVPAVSAALLDDDGRIWVERFQPHRDFDEFLQASSGGGHHWNQESVWHVLAPDGVPLARVRLPPATRLRAVRADRVVVVTRDELDVESVRVFAIDKGEK
jgi:hypothetical protein